MIYNSKKLLAELQAAGLPAESVNSDGIVAWVDGTEHTDELLAAEAVVLKAHDPTDTVALAAEAADVTIQAEWAKSPLYKLPPDQIISTLQAQLDACKDLDSLKAALHDILPLLTVAANRTVAKDVATSVAIATPIEAAPIQETENPKRGNL